MPFDFHHRSPQKKDAILGIKMPFNYTIAGPIPLTTTAGQWAGRTGMKCTLEAVDQETNNSLFMVIEKYDDPIAKAMCNSFAASHIPNWMVTKSQFWGHFDVLQ